jgi:hypothetical protein
MKNRKEKIKRILREYQLKEEFTSTINDLIVKEGPSGYYIEFAKDLETNDTLNLFAGFDFNIIPGYDEFLYGVVILDENSDPKTEIMTRKRQTNKVIPLDILNRGVLFPVV